VDRPVIAVERKGVKMRIWLLIFLVIAVAGCVSIGTWQKEGGTEQETKQAEWDCAREVRSLDPWDRSTFFRLCMGARGWKEIGR
jgi:hypothetical protein